MSKIRNDLSRLVSGKTPVLRGSVLRIQGSTIRVTSPSGIKEFSVADTSGYKIGDVVRFQGNSFLGKIPASLGGTVIVV